MKPKLNPPDQGVKKSSRPNIVKIDLKRGTIEKLEGIEQKVHEILGKKVRVSHDVAINLLMVSSRLEDALTELALESNTPLIESEVKKKW